MEKVLELGDSCNSKYPRHFQIFLDNCVKKYGEKFGANDYLFAAVYFIILETGFSPVGLTGSACDHDSVSFDMRKLRSVTCYEDDHFKVSNQSNKSKCCIYQIPLKLGKHNSSVCELQGVPSAEVNTHLIVNFLSKDPYTIRSLCLNTESYVETNKIELQHKYLLKDLKHLSIAVKNKISIHIKDLILTNEEEGCSPNLLCLPEEIQKKIIYSMKNDVISIQCLSSTCSYFYSFISKDAKLWEEICFSEYSGWVLNKALQEMSTSGDANVFRTAFFKLKIKAARGLIPVKKKKNAEHHKDWMENKNQKTQNNK